MATLHCHIQPEMAHFRNFGSYIRKAKKWCPKTVHEMLEIGLVQVSTAFEHALANQGKFSIVNKKGRDGSDGSDAKLSTVRFHGKGGYSAHVSNTQGKTGKLRVQIYERIQDRFYYFVIPRHAHKRVKYLEIPFTTEGDPRKTNKWWRYQVKTFKQLATA